MTPRVIHVASGREWRGGQNQVRLLARELHRRGDFDQVVITGAGSELARRLETAGVPVRQPRWSAALDPRVLPALIGEARRSPAILHAHDAHALVLARIAARLTGARLVVTRRVDFQLRRPGSWRRADRVIAISRAIREILIADGIPSDQIEVVHSGIDLQEVQSAPEGPLRALYKLAPNVPLAVNVAALVPHKDQQTLVSAAVEMSRGWPALHWVIVGEGPLRPLLEDRVLQAGLENRVHFAGQVSNPWGAIREADVFVMSSREEGLGTSVLDAMALGVPVAATRAGGIPEMLEDGAGLLVPVGDGGALGRAVGRLLEDPSLRQATIERASARLGGFTAATMAERMVQVYRSMYSTG